MLGLKCFMGGAVATMTLLAPMLILGVSRLSAADLSTYRDLQFGMNLAAAAQQGGIKTSDARTVHQRPALIQELDWRPQASGGTDRINAVDPVKDGILAFYNGQLFQMVISYDRYRVEGMTPEDMIEAISSSYGVASRPKAQVRYHSFYGEVADVIARWEDSETSYNLVRSGDRSSFVMVLLSRRLDALAEAAIVEAVRLDAIEAPQREIDGQQKKLEEDRAALEKARLLNKPNFRP